MRIMHRACTAAATVFNNRLVLACISNLYETAAVKYSTYYKMQSLNNFVMQYVIQLMIEAISVFDTFNLFILYGFRTTFVIIIRIHIL